MRLYLSSYRLGDHIDQLLKLVPKSRRIAIIENAIDILAPEDRIQYKKEIYDIGEVFQNLGFQVAYLDLREYFGKKEALAKHLKNFDLLWACGGNAFLLRRAMRQSGFDEILKDLLAKDEIAYGGWSAGICVMGPSLRGIELCDEPDRIGEGYHPEIIWEGLNIIDYALAPHYQSDHPESAMIEEVVAYFEQHQIQHFALRDGEVLFYEGEVPVLLSLEKG